MNVTTARSYTPVSRNASPQRTEPAPQQDRVDLGERVLDGLGYAASTALTALPGVLGGGVIGLGMTATPALLLGNSWGLGLAAVGTVVGAAIGGAFTCSVADLD